MLEPVWNIVENIQKSNRTPKAPPEAFSMSMDQYEAFKATRLTEDFA